MNEQLVTISPDVLSGTPVFYNARVPIKFFFDYIKGGDSLEDFLTDFPSVTKGQALNLLAHAESIMIVNTPVDETIA